MRRAPSRVVLHPIEEQAQLPADAGSGETAALLRAVSRSRMMDYGASLAEATDYVARAMAGAEWFELGTELADRRARSARVAAAAGLAGLAAAELRAAASLRLIAQLRFTTDEGARRSAYAEAVADYDRSLTPGVDGGRGRRVTVTGDRVACWLLQPAAVAPRPTVLVWGGTSGWGPVYHSIARALNQFGLSVAVVELPGQGTPRLQHGHHLGDDFAGIVSDLVSVLLDDEECDGRIGVMGNSMGGTLALHVAAHDDRVDACVVNGGVASPAALVSRYPRQRDLWAAMLGTDLDDELSARLAGLGVDGSVPSVACPFLFVHGGSDPLVTETDIEAFSAAVDHDDRTIVELPGAEHCAYNRPDERNALVGAWLSHRLRRDVA